MVKTVLRINSGF